jgi:hypothetical protein
MSNLITARLKSGEKVPIGYNIGGYYPFFFIRKEWGNIPSFMAMIGWLISNAETIFIGAYGTGSAPDCYTYLDPLEFEFNLYHNWPVMTPPDGPTLRKFTETKDLYGYKHIRMRYYGPNSHKIRVKFVDGIYTEVFYRISGDPVKVHWTWESYKRFS